MGCVFVVKEVFSQRTISRFYQISLSNRGLDSWWKNLSHGINVQWTWRVTQILSPWDSPNFLLAGSITQGGPLGVFVRWGEQRLSCWKRKTHNPRWTLSAMPRTHTKRLLCGRQRSAHSMLFSAGAGRRGSCVPVRQTADKARPQLCGRMVTPLFCGSLWGPIRTWVGSVSPAGLPRRVPAAGSCALLPLPFSTSVGSRSGPAGMMGDPSAGGCPVCV